MKKLKIYDKLIIRQIFTEVLTDTTPKLCYSNY